MKKLVIFYMLRAFAPNWSAKHCQTSSDLKGARPSFGSTGTDSLGSALLTRRTVAEKVTWRNFCRSAEDSGSMAALSLASDRITVGWNHLCMLTTVGCCTTLDFKYRAETRSNAACNVRIGIARSLASVMRQARGFVSAYAAGLPDRQASSATVPDPLKGSRTRPLAGQNRCDAKKKCAICGRSLAGYE